MSKENTKFVSNFLQRIEISYFWKISSENCENCVFLTYIFLWLGSLEQEEICHPFRKAEGVKISSLESSAVIVKSYIPIMHGTQLKTDNKCTFPIKTKNKDDGLFAVIQDINFRRNEDGCVDYIQVMF